MSVHRPASFALLLTVVCHAEPPSIQLWVDLTGAPRQLLQVTELLPAHPGQNSYSYPEWIPGQEHETAAYRVDYHGGEKYAMLERNGHPDSLTTAILAPSH